MKKLNLFFMVMAMLLMGAGFTACSDDDDNNGGAPDLGTPQYEGVSGKYAITAAGSTYESIELGASGNYVVTLNYGGGYYAAASQTATSRAAEGGHKSLFNSGKAGAQTRSTQYGNVIYGTFTSLGDNEYSLEGFGRIRLDYTGGDVTGIEVTTQGNVPATYTVRKEPTMGGDDMTNALCRTWRVEKVRDVITDKETGRKREETVTPENTGSYGTDLAEEVMFSKSGTYLVKFVDNTIGLAEWKWHNRGAGEMEYAWDGEWYGDYVTITFEGNKAVVYEMWDDEYEREEEWTYLTVK